MNDNDDDDDDDDNDYDNDDDDLVIVIITVLRRKDELTCQITWYCAVKMTHLPNRLVDDTNSPVQATW